MTEPTLTCPSCQTEIRLTESLAAPLIADTRKRYEAQLAKKEAEVAAREAGIRDQQQQLAAARQAVDAEVASRLDQERWNDIVQATEEIRPKLLILDTAADVYSGDENTRAQVRAFVGMLRGLAWRSGVAVVLLAHPSVSGMVEGTGRSGSTGWNNTVRSRLYFRRDIKVEQGQAFEDDRNVRILENNKLNYGPSGRSIRMKYDNGVFVSEEPENAPKTANEQRQVADDTFLRLLNSRERAGP